MSIDPTSQGLYPPIIPNQGELNAEIQTIYSSNNSSHCESLNEMISRINELRLEDTQNLHHVILSSQFRPQRQQ